MADTTNVTTTTRIDHPVNVYYDRRLLRRAIPNMPHAQFGQQRDMPQKAGMNIKFRRYAAFGAAKTPLTEAEDPAPIIAEKTDLNATVSEYGAGTKLSSTLLLTGIGQEQSEITDILAEQLRQTLDELCRDTITAAASTTTCSNGSPTATFLNKTDIDTVVETLMGNDAKMITPRISARTGQGTSPIRRAYIGIADTDLKNDLEGVSGFKHVSQYASGGGQYEGELGSTGDVRWILTSNGYSSGGTYYCPIIAENAYGNVRIKNSKRMLIYTPPDKTGSMLQRYALLGWSLTYVCKILNENFIHVLLCTT